MEWNGERKRNMKKKIIYIMQKNDKKPSGFKLIFTDSNANDELYIFKTSTLEF